MAMNDTRARGNVRSYTDITRFRVSGTARRLACVGPRRTTPPQGADPEPEEER